MDAEKREKVIRGLELCSRQCGGPELCEQCPYYNEPFPCSNTLLHDALALLKEQEPRMMTLEEVRDSDDWMWIEYLSGYVEWNKQSDIFGYYEDGVMWNDSTFDCNDSYGIEWRCWTSRPSLEKMRETKWKERAMNDIDKLPAKCRDCAYWEAATYPWCCGDCTNRMKKPVSDFVSRQWLIDEYHRRHEGPPGGALKMIEEAPAADVEPKRKTGHWIKEGDDAMCSVCDEILCGEAWEDLDPIDDIGLHYCPNCGSRMLHEPPKED